LLKGHSCRAQIAAVDKPAADGSSAPCSFAAFVHACAEQPREGAAAQVACKCKASLFAYPPPVTQEAAAAAAKVPTAVLSTTARARDKAKKKEKKRAEAAADAPAGAPGDARSLAHALCLHGRAPRAPPVWLSLLPRVWFWVWCEARSQLARDCAASKTLLSYASAAAAPYTCALFAPSLWHVPLQAAGCPPALEVLRATCSSACCLRVWSGRRTSERRPVN